MQERRPSVLRSSPNSEKLENSEFHAKFLFLKILTTNPNFKTCCGSKENPTKTWSALLGCHFGTFGFSCLLFLCLLLLYYAGNFAASSCVSAPQLLAHMWPWFAMVPTLTPIPHDLSVQVLSSRSLTQCFNITISSSQKRDSGCLALVLPTVVAGGQVGSYLLVSWDLRVRQFSMDSKEMIPFYGNQLNHTRGDLEMTLEKLSQTSSYYRWRNWGLEKWKDFFKFKDFIS